MPKGDVEANKTHKQTDKMFMLIKKKIQTRGHIYLYKNKQTNKHVTTKLKKNICFFKYF